MSKTLAESRYPELPADRICEFCKLAYPFPADRCPHCGRPSKFPNVEHAQALAAALGALYEQEAGKAPANSVQALETLARATQAIMTRWRRHVEWMTNSPYEMLPVHLHMLDSGMRSYRYDEEWEAARQVAAQQFHPGYGAKMHFGNLSPDPKAMTSYGDFILVFREDMISHRATVFPMNSAEMVRYTDVTPQSPDTRGVPAVWDERHKVAVVKLAGKLTAADDLPRLQKLLFDPDHQPRPDFIEVHVYGPITLSSFAAVYAKPKELPESLECVIREMFPTVQLIVNNEEN